MTVAAGRVSRALFGTESIAAGRDGTSRRFFTSRSRGSVQVGRIGMRRCSVCSARGSDSVGDACYCHADRGGGALWHATGCAVDFALAPG